MKIAGHRGLPLEFPDNSLAGIAAATAVCDYIELDVRRSADGIKVLSHDPEIGGFEIAGTSWSDLSRLDLGDGHSPTTLEEVFEAVGSFPLDIEIKNSPLEPGFDPVGTFASEVAGLARPDDVVTCFFWPTMDVIRDVFPTTSTGLLIDRKGSLTEAARHAAEKGHGLLAPHWSLLLVDEAVSRSLVLEFEIATWTVDDREVARQLADLGIDSIISNDPVGIAEALGLRPLGDDNRS